MRLWCFMAITTISELLNRLELLYTEKINPQYSAAAGQGLQSMFLAFLPEHACCSGSQNSPSASPQLPISDMQDHGDQEKLLHHQGSPLPGKSVLHTGSKVAARFACAISVW